MREYGAITRSVPNRKAPSANQPTASRKVEITGKVRRYLRGLGHELTPVVQIGRAGLTPGVKDELERALSFHELIKVRLSKECPIERDEAGEQLASLTLAKHIQTLGSSLLFYRPRPKDPRIELPGPVSTRGATAHVEPRKPSKSKRAVPKGRSPSSRRSSPSGFAAKKKSK
jgi:RNA-binding protein